MKRWSAKRISKIMPIAFVALVLLVGATAANAQDREGRWEFTIGTEYQLSTTIDGEQGTGLDTKNDFGFTIGGGYNFTDKLATSFGLQWNGIGYNATATDEDGAPVRISGSYDQFIVAGNVVFNLLDGPLTPYVGAGIGWTWIDTNIPNGPPYTWCWWDPWWGYVCSTSYPTQTENAFSYQAVVGVRYDFPNGNNFMKVGYTSQWMNFDAASGTPRFDVFTLDFGWMF